MIRTAIITASVFFCLVSDGLTQVDIADKGEDGIGLGIAGAFSSNASAYGANLSGIIKGMVDFGFSLARASSGSASGWITGGQITALPLRTTDPAVRWSLGGYAAYESGKLKSSSRPKYYFGSLSSSRSFTSAGGLMTIDIALSHKTDFQLAGSFGLVKVSGSSKNLNNVTVGAAIITKSTARNFYIGTTVSVPSDESYTTFGVQMGYFFKRARSRGKV